MAKRSKKTRSARSARAKTRRHAHIAIDPVNDPAYNMQNIAKQSILLEEHLAIPQKRCRICIVKHFLHIIGLTEEAITMAGDGVDKFPMLRDMNVPYQALLDKWLTAKDDDEVIRHIVSALRENRRSLIKQYFLA